MKRTAMILGWTSIALAAPAWAMNANSTITVQNNSTIDLKACWNYITEEDSCNKPSQEGTNIPAGQTMEFKTENQGTDKIPQQGGNFFVYVDPKQDPDLRPVCRCNEYNQAPKYQQNIVYSPSDPVDGQMNMQVMCGKLGQGCYFQNWNNDLSAQNYMSWYVDSAGSNISTDMKMDLGTLVVNVKKNPNFDWGWSGDLCQPLQGDVKPDPVTPEEAKIPSCFK